jgi:acyl carrier protein
LAVINLKEAIMHDAQEQLVNCFSTVFPTLSRSEILEADSQSVSGWDSLALVTLLAVIEEEFAIQFPPSDVEQLTSFDAFSKYISKQTMARGNSASAQVSTANV